MTTLADRPNTALVVIDVQNDVVAGSFARDSVVGNIATLVERARAAGTPVIWVQHADDGLVAGTEGWQYVPELTFGDDEPVVHKHYGDSFEETVLEDELAQRGVGKLIVAGAQTDACVRSTLHGALARGYDAVLVSDAHTTEEPYTGELTAEQVVAHTNMYWNWQTAPGRSGGTLVTADVDFSG